MPIDDLPREKGGGAALIGHQGGDFRQEICDTMRSPGSDVADIRSAAATRGLALLLKNEQFMDRRRGVMPQDIWQAALTA